MDYFALVYFGFSGFMDFPLYIYVTEDDQYMESMLEKYFVRTSHE